MKYIHAAIKVSLAKHSSCCHAQSYMCMQRVIKSLYINNFALMGYVWVIGFMQLLLGDFSLDLHKNE